MNTNAITQYIKERAYAEGFAYIGISKAEKMEPEAKRLAKWLEQGMHGKMSYMENHFDMRVDPTLLVPGAKSVISLMYNYYPEATQQDPNAPKLARYAQGKDYHHVLKPKLKTLLFDLEKKLGRQIIGRCFTDSAPILERDWARRSGLGWVGKNTLLIHPKKGSYYFLAEIILDVEFDYDGPIKDYCGTCTKCIDACPTDAIPKEGYVVDGSKCISYFTIELKDEIPAEMKGKFENWMFGCDICQEVCPWNRFSTPHQEPLFDPHPDLLQMTKRDWQEISEDVFRKIFKGSPVKRTKFSGLTRNIKFLEE
jgi:epoxyqueuosine reductase